MRKNVTLKDIPIGGLCYLNENDITPTKILDRNITLNLVRVDDIAPFEELWYYEWTPAYIEV